MNTNNTTPDNTNQQHHTPASTLQHGHSSGLLSSFTNKALEKIFVGIVYTVIVGSAVYFWTNIKQIEATIAQHHGQGWAELKNVVQTSQIQSQVSSAKTELLSQISQQEHEIRVLKKRLESVEAWTLQGDKIMTARDKSKYKGHALYTDDGSNERLCIVNYAHPNGRFFKINDRVKIINEDSHRGETTECIISSTAYDNDQPTVLFTLNKNTSNTLSFTKDIGRINISASLADIPEDRRWKTLADFRGYVGGKDLYFLDPTVQLPAPAAGHLIRE